MKTSEIVQLDCREKENEVIIQQVLRKIKPLASCPDGRIPIAKLERCMQVLCNKYGYTVSLYMDPESNKSFPIWRCYVIMRSASITAGTNVFGCSAYEAMAKAVILMYSHSRRASKQ